MGRYEVLELLGKGGAGEVYRVLDLARGGRPLALKRIRARVDERLRAAFEREFAIMASLSVFGIAEVFDFGVAEAHDGFAGGAFFTRAFVEGVSLDQAGAAMSPAERLALFTRLCAIISPLHRVGVVHGDLKPGNVVVSESGQVSLIDFGLSRALGSVGDAAVAGGTPPFMAPENLKGEPISIASDVYALGTMLWLLLTGELPFAERGVRATRAKLAGEVPKTDPLLDALSMQACAVALRALQAEPLDRYPTVAELMEALLPLVPAAARPGPAPFVPPRPRGRGELLSEIEAELAATSRPGATRPRRIVALKGEQGAGKTLLMRELKWRLQLNGVQVVELFVAEGVGRPAQQWLLGELTVLLGRSLSQAGAAQAPGDQSEAVLTRLSELAAGRPTVLLVDDLDQAEPALSELLRAALHEERGEAVSLVYAAADDQAGAVKALTADSIFALPPLADPVVSALATDALGPVDASVLRAVADVARGVPAILMEVLVALSASPAPTEADVRALSPGQAGAALARTRLLKAPPHAAPALLLLALTESAPMAAVQALLPEPEEVDRLVHGGLLSGFGQEVRLADATIGKTVLADAGPARAAQQAKELLAKPGLWEALSEVGRARLAVAAKDVASMLEWIPKAARALQQAGATLAATHLQQALLEHTAGAARAAVELDIARASQSLGQHEAAVKHARSVIAMQEAPTAVRAEASLVAARGLTALAQFDDAAAILSADFAQTDPETAARACQELARVQMRRGDYAAAEEAADRGLELADPGGAERVELLCCKGLLCGYRDRGDDARAFYEAALSHARAVGTATDQAKVLSYLAIGSFRAGELVQARELFAQALEMAREVSDLGLMCNASLNLGAIMFYLGDPGASERHYEAASRLAKRAGSLATDLQARNNLAHLHVFLGLYEQARAELRTLLDAATQAGHKYVLAQLSAVAGDLHARTGDIERALIAYDEAIARYTDMGQMREAAEHHQDAAEALLERAGPVDLSAAVARLSSARGLVERHGLSDLKVRQELLTACARLARGDAEDVLPELESILTRAEGERSRETYWMALSAMGTAHALLGADFAASSFKRRAVEVLEEQALRLPREYRDAFWHDPRRRRVRAQAATAAENAHTSTQIGPGLSEPLSDPRVVRLLEIVKRLAAEHDLSRLLERIVDSAVELSSAERGYVLLVDERGQLEPQVARGRSGAMDDAAIAFSRSIAEAVLIDGDSIVTTDATDDGRLREFASVHQLTLRSVACLPIRSLEGTVGVLYLEHRRSRGRFNEQAVELLHTFADQAAIAVQNARLLEDNRRREQELVAKNEELALAKQQLEEALSARVEQLHEVQGELSRLGARGKGAPYHGIIGTSRSMQRVWTLVDRLKDANVPVVIRGESGTGKDLVARAIHYAGARHKAPFVALNCGALPESLLESELFGHVRGAFSGADRDKQGLIARADGGTLFLDEVSDMPEKMQVDMLRVLQEGTVCRLGSDVEERVTVRFLAASQRDLKELVAAGRFREDLYYRLNVVELPLPPLRERREDIPDLCRHFLSKFSQQQGLPEKVLSPKALRHLMGERLPGNVRELEHRLMQAVLLSSDLSLSPSDLGISEDAAAKDPVPPDSEFERQSGVTAPSNLEEHRDLERQRILAALEEHNWNRARAAKAMGMARRTFYRRLQDYQIL